MWLYRAHDLVKEECSLGFEHEVVLVLSRSVTVVDKYKWHNGYETVVDDILEDRRGRRYKVLTNTIDFWGGRRAIEEKTSLSWFLDPAKLRTDAVFRGVEDTRSAILRLANGREL